MPNTMASRGGSFASSPWLWSCAGAAGCLMAIGLAWTAGAALEPMRLACIWLGLLCSGIGVARRFRSEVPSRLAQSPGFLIVPAVVFGLLALGITVNLFASWAGTFILGPRPGLALILWLFLTPLSALAAWQCARRSVAAAKLDRLQEASLSLLLASLTAFLAAFALTNPDSESSLEWFTIQHFLYIAGFAALAAAALTVVDDITRRAVVSGLVLFHFGGIVTATLTQPPSPWLADQIWARIYRPYLQFMYLSNAYHFYSPEPGPASFLWFRMQYTDAKGQPDAHWFKMPRLDEKGRHGHKTTLEYQRTLSMTENTILSETINAESEWFQKTLEKRLARTPEEAKKVALIGQPPGPKELLIPMHPVFARSQQYQRPQPDQMLILESYVRHVMVTHQRDFPDRSYQSVKIYRVVHRPAPTNQYLQGWPPTDPQYYVPIYLGDYDTKGKLLNPDDPLLYWQLPIMRDKERAHDFSAPIYDYARLHAGDPYWRRIETAGFFVWVNDKDQPAP